MSLPRKTLVRDFGWVHTGIGLFGTPTFAIGSVFFCRSSDFGRPWLSGCLSKDAAFQRLLVGSPHSCSGADAFLAAP
jgi:hypothetical protein